MEYYIQNKTHVLIRYFIIGIELLALCYGFLLLDYLMTGDWGFLKKEEVLLFYVYFISWLGIGALGMAYSHKSLYELEQLIKSSSFTLFFLGIISSLLYQLYPEFFPAFILKAVMGISLALSVRFLIGLAFKHRRSLFSLAGGENRIMILGMGNTADKLRGFFQDLKGNQIISFRSLIQEAKTEEEVLNLLQEDLLTFQAYCLENKVDEIYYALPLDSPELIESIADFADNHYIQFKLANNFQFQDKYEDFSIALYDHTPIISLRKEPLTQFSNQLIKRVFDLMVSSFVILFVLPILFLLIGIAIRLESKGPILFLQKRSGLKNQPFTCFKFRTMRVDRERENTAYLQARKNDPRITKVGAFLRETSLDEFPQFINVFLGQMSVVGPRPHPMKLNEKYIPLIKKYPYRYFITPGITGYAQVNGYRGETKSTTDMQGRIDMDSWYIEHWSLGLDIKIIFQTIRNALKGDEKAY